ncbi:hypothetical protein N0V84_003903 [Fusarium piperis]|uniref:Uncharacterized protein n=1 Tax=Fusarium piperis TaxID=1435070 RepID=A0A9W8WGL3_9HYPO|nr:hypothetical protein N0V84_003903 [Fusarium piperis]
MTGRGRAGNPVPKLPRPDATLDIRPVPRERHFNVRSVGPGASPDIRQAVRSIEDLEQDLVVPDYSGQGRHHSGEWRDQAVRKFLDRVISDGQIDLRNQDEFTPEVTWGLCIFVTSYSKEAQKNLDSALSMLVKVVDRHFRENISPEFAAFGQEAFKRFKLDVFENQELLEDASGDRVREEFNSYVRSLHLWDAHHDPDKHRARHYHDNLNRPPGSSRLKLCIALDEAKINELAAFKFPINPKEDYRALRKVSVKIVCRRWNYPDEANCETGYFDGSTKKFFSGIDQLPLNSLIEVYEGLSNWDVDEMFPMFKF